MTRLYLVRHGQSLANVNADSDPGLATSGRLQSIRLAANWARLGPLSIVSSPASRARQSAEPLAAAWNVEIQEEPRLAEIPTPGTVARGERAAWLATAMSGQWADMDLELQKWRNGVRCALLDIGSDAVVFTHFIAINIAVGLATGDDSVVVTHPGLMSCTAVDHDGSSLSVVELGKQDDSAVA